MIGFWEFLKNDWAITRNRWKHRASYVPSDFGEWDDLLTQDPLKRIRRFWRAPHVRAAARGKTWRGPLYGRKKRYRQDLLYLTSQLYAIVRGNAPLAKGLQTTLPTTPSVQAEHVVLALRAGVIAGKSLSETMREMTRFFPRYYVDLVRVGEETGSLAESLTSILRQQHEQRARWKTLRGWGAYLAFMLCVMFGHLLFLSTTVLPEFVDLLRDFGAKPPPPIMVVMDISQMLWWWKWEIVLLIVLCLFPRGWLPGARALTRRRTWKRLWLYLPVFGSVHEWGNLSHVAAVLKQLLDAGVPLDRALDDAAGLDIDPYYQGILLRVRERVERGSSLSDAVKVERGLPASFKTLVALGDTSGMLPEALGRVSEFYDQQARTRTRVLVQSLAPLVVLFIGAGVLLIMLSVFMTNTTIFQIMAAM